MSSKRISDCVIIGYHDQNFAKYASRQKDMEGRSGAYHEVKTNSVLLRGQRYTYMELINQAIGRATGEDPRLNVFEAPLLGAFYLSSFLQKRGFQAEVVNFFTYQQEQLAALLARKPRSVAITTTFYVDHEAIIEIVEFVAATRPTRKSSSAVRTSITSAPIWTTRRRNSCFNTWERTSTSSNRKAKRPSHG